MSTTLPFAQTETPTNYLNADYGWKSWLFATDHKRIALLYLFSITAFFFVGGAFAVAMRINLLTPEGIFTHDTYNKLFTMHGIIMVFFFLLPSIPATLGNFLVPMMIGARDLAFPRINLLSWYIYIVGGIFTLTAVVQGGVDTGWTFYAPFSSSYSNTHVILAAMGIFVSGFSSILTGLNFIVTIHKMRAPGMTWNRLPLFIWGHYATSLIQVLGTPVIAITMVLLGLERLLHAGIFDPTVGGDPVLFQHLFWFYSHPAVYIMILPGMAVISEIVACFSRKAIFGYSFVAYSSIAIAVFSFLVWGHHLFVSGQSMYASMVFSFFSFLVAIPSAIKVFNWTATMYKGSVSFETPMLYAFGFIGLFTIGGLTGLFLGDHGNRRPRHRYLFCHRAFPLCDGGRNGDGLHGRDPLLVSEDFRPPVPGGLGQVCGAPGLRWIQSDVLPAVHSWIPGNAAPLCALRSRISGVERDVDRRRFHSCRRLPDTDDLPRMGLAVRTQVAAESVEREGPGVGAVPTPPPTFNFDHQPVVTEPAYNYSGEEQEVEIGG